MKLRQYSIIIFFLFITIGSGIYSMLGNFDSLENDQANSGGAAKNLENDESYFKVVDYYLLDELKPFLRLEATEMAITKRNTELVAFNPDGIIYRRNKEGIEEEPVYFSAKNSRGLMSSKELYLQDEVAVRVASSTLKSHQMTILDNGKYIEARGDVKTTNLDRNTKDQILIDSNFVIYRPDLEFFEYQQNVKGLVKRARQYEENVSFTTDLLTLTGPKSLIEMKGNVTLKKGILDASSNEGAIYLENYNKRLKYYSLSDDVRLQETLTLDGRVVLRKGFSEKLEGLISEKKVILTGLPKIFQDKDVIKGNRIIIRENIETVEVDDANTNIILQND